MQTKKVLREALALLRKADELLEEIRFQHDFEWGEHAHCRLDTELRHMISRIEDSRRSIGDLLIRFAGKRIPKEW